MTEPTAGSCPLTTLPLAYTNNKVKKYILGVWGTSRKLFCLEADEDIGAAETIAVTIY